MKSKISNPVGEGFIPSRVTRQPVGEVEGRPQGSPLQVPSRYPRRQSTRLKDFDYAQAGAVFFITLCSLGKRQIFVKNDFNTEIIECVKNEQKRVGHAIYVFFFLVFFFIFFLKKKKFFGGGFIILSSIILCGEVLLEHGKIIGIADS